MSFLELQIALVLLLVGVIALIELPPLVLEGTRLSEQHVTAARCAQHLLELELAHTYDYETGQPAASGWATVTPSLCPGVPAGRYDFQITRADHPRMGPTIRVLTVQVRWMDPEAKRHGTWETYTLSGYKPRPTSAM
jgi:hypothetical protein